MQNTRKQNWQEKGTTCLTVLGLAGFSGGSFGADNLITNTVNGLNQTQTSMSQTISAACSERNPLLSKDFKARCDSLVGAALTPNLVPQARNAVQVTAPEQVIANGTQSTRVTAGQLNTLQSAIDARTNLLFANLTTKNNALLANAPLRGATGGAASGDSGLASPFGIWFNNAYTTGTVDSTFQETGYDFGNWAFSLGADYRVMDNLAIGTAFSYQKNSADFNRSGGSTDTDVYTGTIYASYHPIEHLHLNGTASYGGSDYDTKRNINYSISPVAVTNRPQDIVNTRATSNTGGEHYAFSARAGYDFSFDALTIEPYARFNYYSLKVDAYQEQGGDGWALRVGDQNVRSLITSLGTQLSYSLSYPWGIVVPQVYGEWLHQFKDSARVISASFVGDPAAQQFGTLGSGPTRNFGNVGFRLLGSFAHGLSGYVGYDALVGYDNVNSNRVMLGGRWEF